MHINKDIILHNLYDYYKDASFIKKVNDALICSWYTSLDYASTMVVTHQ